MQRCHFFFTPAPVGALQVSDAGAVAPCGGSVLTLILQKGLRGPLPDNMWRGGGFGNHNYRGIFILYKKKKPHMQAKKRPL